MTDIDEAVLEVIWVKACTLNLVALRVVLVTLCELRNVSIKGRREEKCLTCLWNHVEKSADLWHEAHVSHTVGLIDYNNIYLVEANHVLINEVAETAWASNKDVNTATHCLALLLVTNTSINGEDAKAACMCKRREVCLNLCCEFACWSED